MRTEKQQTNQTTNKVATNEDKNIVILIQLIQEHLYKVIHFKKVKWVVNILLIQKELELFYIRFDVWKISIPQFPIEKNSSIIRKNWLRIW